VRAIGARISFSASARLIVAVEVDGAELHQRTVAPDGDAAAALLTF
jgi:hypothetical protein